MSTHSKIRVHTEWVKQIYIYIYIYIYIHIHTYIQKLDKTHMLYIDSANPTWTDRFPVFYLSFEGCQSCKDLYFLQYGIPGFRSEIWCRVFVICFSFNMINLNFLSWLMSKIIMILYKMKIFTNFTNSPLFTLNISMASFWRFFRES